MTDAGSEGFGKGSEPARRLVELMGRKLVVALALGSVVGASLLCLFAIFYPTSIPSQTSRFFICLFIAFLFSVFVFTLYPSDYKLDITKAISVPFILIGPAALWIGLFLVFWNLLPRDDVTGTIFSPKPADKHLYYSTTWVLGWKPSEPPYYKLKLTNDQNANDPGTLTGFYIKFDAEHSQYTAEIGTGPSNEEIETKYQVVFSRGSSTYVLEQLPDGRKSKR